MPITVEYEGDNVIYICSGFIRSDDINTYFELRKTDYQKLGDAMGIILDARLTTNTRLGVPGLRIIQKNASYMKTDMPMAIVGNRDNFIASFLKTIGTMTGNNKRISFHTDIDIAKQWIEEWFQRKGVDRSTLRGQFTESNRPS